MTEQYQELVDWVITKKKLPVDFSLDQDLVDSGILDSLFFVEYVLMIQELSGKEIEVGEELLESTRSLTKVKTNFFQ
ncbi:hypothetical protein GCM10008090_00260 [Arenicella chitinivorans]|jgi:acyl carrier protein|uniref:Carrier domain-containing protein n=1 Tax=Arenicella chitinivorans TaxID=1329800 RepID=A0A918RFL5_9GAMM|nr:hypothetical protein [Arenicella chitinivorans]GGZ96023.1 hypothetical protein GCM10008090_00260 [Arenicella chitinivorans]